jgi:hypothetical protein
LTVKSMISIKNDEEQLITAPVLIPNYKDCDACRGEKELTTEEIKQISQEFMAKHQIVDKQHDYFETGQDVGNVVESWQLREPMTLKNVQGEEKEYPTGTWMATLHVTDNDTWDNVKKGVYTGFSLTALSKDIADKLATEKTIKSMNKERVLIKDLENPVGYTISIVESPCVYDATFCSVKSTPPETPSQKAGRTLSKDNKSSLTKARDILNNLLNLDSKNDTKPKGDETVTDEGSKKEKDGLTVDDVTNAVQKAIEPFDARLKELEGKSEKADTQKCPKCKATCPSDAKFCPSCGAKLTNSGAGKSDEENNDDGTQQAGTKSLTNNDTGKNNPQPAVKSVYEATGRDALGVKILKN